MGSANFSINYNAILSGISEDVSAGMAVLKAPTGYVPATLANRTLYSKRADGIALDDGEAEEVIRIAHDGLVDEDHTNLSTGTASWIRVKDDATLERCTPASGNDLVGKCDVYGNLHATFNQFDSDNYAGGGGGGGGGDASYPIDLTDGAEVDVPAAGLISSDGTALASVTTSAGVRALLSDETGTGAMVFANTPTLVTPEIGAATGTSLNLSGALTLGTDLSVPNGGTGASSFTSGNILLGAGASAITSFTPGTGVVTWATTPSGANLASALTTALSLAKVGAPTGTGVATVNGGAWDAAATGTTGTGDFVREDTPTLDTPELNSPTLNSPVIVGDTNRVDDSVANVLTRGNVASTASTSPTTVCSFTTFDGYVYAVDVITTVASFGATATPRASRYKRSAFYYRNGGSVTLVGAIESGTDKELNAGDALTLTISGDDILVRGTAADANTRSWHTEMRIQLVPMGTT